MFARARRMRRGVLQNQPGTSVAARDQRHVGRNVIREVPLQGKHYFSIALGAILATGSVAMLTHGPHAADARATAVQTPDEAAAKAAAPTGAVVATPGQR